MLSPSSELGVGWNLLYWFVQCVEPQLRTRRWMEPQEVDFIGLFQGSIGGAPVLGTHALPGFQPAGPDPA